MYKCTFACRSLSFSVCLRVCKSYAQEARIVPRMVCGRVNLCGHEFSAFLDIRLHRAYPHANPLCIEVSIFGYTAFWRKF